MTPAEFKATRERLGLSQAELAHVLHLSTYSRIWEYETGKKPVTPMMADYLAAIEAGFRPPHWPVTPDKPPQTP